jgi:hypothetical protein
VELWKNGGHTNSLTVRQEEAFRSPRGDGGGVPRARRFKRAQHHQVSSIAASLPSSHLPGSQCSSCDLTWRFYGQGSLSRT